MGRRSFYFDWIIFFPVVLLSSISLVTLLSIGHNFFYSQLLFVFLGLVLFYLLSRFDFSIFQYLVYFLYIACILFLLLSFLGPNVRGSSRWLEIGDFRLQPSEFIKPFLCLSFAGFIMRHPPLKIKTILIHTIIMLVPSLLVFLQPDLGNSLIFASIWLSLMIFGGISLRYIAAVFLGGISIIPLSFSFLREYQRLRILAFLNPWFDPQGAGYNAIQSMITVGSGQLFGRGFGKGTQSFLKFLPEHHTDFIFAALTELFGFMGSTVVLVLYFVFLWRLLSHIRNHAHNKMVVLYISGLFIQLFVQIVINIGMNMGIVPITGITLPFLSYGGSSLLTSWISLGILMSAIQKPRVVEN